jgi:hypothetical protein
MPLTYIWTNHAQKRRKERKIAQKLIDQALQSPDRILHRESGVKEFQKIIAKKTIAALVKRNHKGEHIIISCWVNPPNPGTKDYRRRLRYFEMQRSSFMKKLWLMLLNKLGL